MLVALVAGLLVLGGIPLDLLIGAGSVLGAWELCDLLSRLPAPAPPWLVIGLTVWLAERAVLPGAGGSIELILVAAVLAGMVAGVLLRIPWAGWAAGLGGGLYLGIGLGTLLALYHWPGAAAGVGLRLLAIVVGAVVATDTLAYFAGRAVGRHRHPFFPSISPQKSMEGAIGGLIGSVLITGIAGPLVLALNPVWAIVLGVLVAVAAEGGDLVESALNGRPRSRTSGRLDPRARRPARSHRRSGAGGAGRILLAGAHRLSLIPPAHGRGRPHPTRGAMPSPPRRVVLLGATGSIGRQAVDVISRFPDRFQLVGAVAHRDLGGLAALVDRLGVGRAALVAPDRDREVPAGWGIGLEAACEVAAMPADIVCVAITGAAALRPTLAALDAGTAVATATKEVLVMAGEVVRARSLASGARIVPIDSEHSALWQCLRGEDPASISRLILTASGGAFRDRDPATFASATPEEALRHPNWNMGPKVTIDTATMMNKGLEVIEAHFLFDVDYSRIDVLIQPSSIIHSMVEFRDGATMAQMGAPDMRVPDRPGPGRRGEAARDRASGRPGRSVPTSPASPGPPAVSGGGGRPPSRGEGRGGASGAERRQ